MNIKQQNQLEFVNSIINKKKLQQLMYLTFHNYGVIKSSLIADRVKNLTFHYATLSGLSLSVEDLRVPTTKRSLLGLAGNVVEVTEQNYNSGNITTVERFQKIIDIWNNSNNALKDEVLKYFRESDPLNPLYIMAFSGARGNISQVRQLVGMRGLMADPQGEIIDLPIKSNFREGLKVTEYIISSYGARKGLVDTALRTADSGYLTRRLVDVAQDIIIREEDCLTSEGLSLHDLLSKYKSALPIHDRLVGRLLAKAITLNINNQKIYLPAETELTTSLVSEILQANVQDIIVRSPLTCTGLRSVCRKCYGWHLSYSKLIDLGEAVGILAAQSIGEPGTQLTMRTFHTGGVFSGDLTKQIRAPFSGTIKYSLTSSVNLVRTIHGEKGFQLNDELSLIIETKNQTFCSLRVPKATLLLVNNEQQVYKDQIIAEIKKDANLILEEDRKNIYTEVSGETFFQNIRMAESFEGDGAKKRVSKTTGIIWVLYGDRYTLQDGANLNLTIGQKIKAKDTIAHQVILNKYPGILKFYKNENELEARIITSAMTLENSIINENAFSKADNLTLITGSEEKKFHLSVKNNTPLRQGQTIAQLIDDTYHVKTGGIVYYSTDPLPSKKKKPQNRIFNGSLYWVPEETYQLNEEYLLISEGRFITKGTKISTNQTATISGFCERTNGDCEIKIKPGELYKISDNQFTSLNKINYFAQPGELLFPEVDLKIRAQKLSFIEKVVFDGLPYLLIRPVLKFKVPQEKGFTIEHKFFHKSSNRGVLLRTVKRIFYKDGEHVRTNGKGVDLLQTFLVLDLKKQYLSLNAQIEYTQDQKSNLKKLKINIYESISLNQVSFNSSKLDNIVFSRYLAQQNQYILANTIIGKINLIAKFGGTLMNVQRTNANIEFLILKENDLKTIDYSTTGEEPLVQVGDIIRTGTRLTKKLRSKYAGQVYRLRKGIIELRLCRPYLISHGTILRVGPKSLVEKSDMLATLVYKKLKTVDIVQGLPKVEEILEARKIKNGCILAPNDGTVFFKDNSIDLITSTGESIKFPVESKDKINFINGQTISFLEPLTDGPISPHQKLEVLFDYFSARYDVHTACKKSFKRLQLFLVNEVQRTYSSQGVDIADKHIEIIVKQMTSKVRVYFGGDTTLLPGEILDINQAEIITTTTLRANKRPPSYRPILLGLTKAALNSDSFISAASFQETTRVLTEAAIEGKKDWLNGLKENVIIGRLIPAGTGFNSFENLKKTGGEISTNTLIKQAITNKIKSSVLRERLN